ncbi:MAG: ribonuclease domain-containing protein [Caldimonas sp.]
MLLGPEVQARRQEPFQGLVAVAELPVEAQSVHRLIRSGGPFVHPKDGAVFGNRERLLPPQSRGFYREYTVATPGARDRGARRIVCGGRETKAPEACYYTADHYSSFRRITP